ncbi:unnamed protein product [Candidula unifasciata]|uniref:Hcy-binding domain-containing protein n=1 Tax=Candidula unifasciata TaxID=100452 RepID=A0A8S3ZE70_9EUPU|nr:unnamed protein product [Candidula unifasciata]
MADKQKQIVVLDGGTGIALMDMGHTFITGQPLWSAAVVYTHPQDLIKLHEQFYVAGADVAVTATYQASVEGYKTKFDLSDAEALRLIQRGVELAKTARDQAEEKTGRHGYVAASVGPYGATLCDMSEYHGRYADTMTREELRQWHLPRLKALVESQPDLLAIETIPVVKEAEAILDNLQDFPGTKAWVTFQCKDGSNTAHGESIKDAVAAVVNYDGVVAVGVNCVHPDFVTSLLQNMAELSLSVPLIVEPNGGMFDHDGRPTPKEKLSEHVEEWVKAGATWIGGCCYVNPPDIADMRAALARLPGVTLLQKESRLF